MAAVEACGVLFEAMLVNVKAIVNLGVVPLVQFQEADRSDLCVFILSE